MAEYIEREKVIAEIDKGDLLVGDNAKWAKEILCRTPTADAVEVVKCSECQKRYTMNCALWYSTFNDKEYFCGAMSNDNFFCACGERKCDNENPN
jgi:hypothetical protein